MLRQMDRLVMQKKMRLLIFLTPTVLIMLLKATCLAPKLAWARSNFGSCSSGKTLLATIESSNLSEGSILACFLLRLTSTLSLPLCPPSHPNFKSIGNQHGLGPVSLSLLLWYCLSTLNWAPSSAMALCSMLEPSYSYLGVASAAVPKA